MSKNDTSRLIESSNHVLPRPRKVLFFLLACLNWRRERMRMLLAIPDFPCCLSSTNGWTKWRISRNRWCSIVFQFSGRQEKKAPSRMRRKRRIDIENCLFLEKKNEKRKSEKERENFFFFSLAFSFSSNWASSHSSVDWFTDRSWLIRRKKRSWNAIVICWRTISFSPINSCNGWKSEKPCPTSSSMIFKFVSLSTDIHEEDNCLVSTRLFHRLRREITSSWIVSLITAIKLLPNSTKD